MQGPLSGRRGVALYLLAWLAAALVVAAVMVYAAGAGWINSLLFAVPLMLVYAVACGFSAYYMCRAWPLAQRNGMSILAVFCVSAVLAAAGWTGLGVAWNALWQAGGEGIECASRNGASWKRGSWRRMPNCGCCAPRSIRTSCSTASIRSARSPPAIRPERAR
jgi:hypothetical protein